MSDRERIRRARALAVASAAVAMLAAGCADGGANTRDAGGASAAAASGRAADVLETLTVGPSGAERPYRREEFGRPWADADRNGCGTRDDILNRDLTDRRVDGGCTVTRGTLRDPYTGTTVTFVRGDGNQVDIDHAVALGNVWVSGGSRWTPDRRLAIANDPLNLLAVSASANRAKGDRDAAGWLPPDPGYRCPYVARQIAVKAAYGLRVTPAERDAMREVLRGCPDERVPSAGPSAVPPAAPTGAAPRPGSVAPPRSTSSAATAPFPDCAAARAAGAAPLRAGAPGWNPALDRDGDLVACE